MNEKMCTRCLAVKASTAFPANATKASGRDSECKRCKRTRESSPLARADKRERTLMRVYGITLDTYEAMAARQANLCAICGKPEDKTNAFGERMPLSVDHNHKTGAVRGLLCGKHNKAIGLLGDEAHLFEAALIYLKEGL